MLRGVAFGVTFEVRVDDPRWLPRLRARFPPGWSGTGRAPVVLLSLRHASAARNAAAGPGTRKPPPRDAGHPLQPSGRRSPQVNDPEVFDTSGAFGGARRGDDLAHDEVSDTFVGDTFVGALRRGESPRRPDEVLDSGAPGGGRRHEVLDTSGGPPRRREPSRRVNGLSLAVDGRTVGRGLTPRQALDVFESELQLAVARRARPAVFVHAGVVAVDGHAILLPGRSGAGKTTLVRALVAAGARYFSDEYAVLDRRGRVHPYARRPSVRGGAGPKQRHPVPARRGRRPVPVGLIVETRYRPEGSWNPVPLSAGERVLTLLANTVPARDRPGEVLATLARAASGALGLRSDRGSAGATARALLQLAATSRRPARTAATRSPGKRGPARRLAPPPRARSPRRSSPRP